MNPLRKTIIGAALVGSTLAGGAIGAALVGGVAGAESPASTSTTAASSTAPTPQAPSPSGNQQAPQAPQGGPRQAPPRMDPSKGGHQANGVTEELLTGDTAAKVKAAAEAEVDGGTVLRVETDAEGATYEAHVQKSDGSQVTVKFDADFKVTSVEDGPR